MRIHVKKYVFSAYLYVLLIYLKHCKNKGQLNDNKQRLFIQSKGSATTTFVLVKTQRKKREWGKLYNGKNRRLQVSLI